MKRNAALRARATGLALVLLSATLPAVMAPKAWAALVLTFDSLKAPPGTEVSAENVGKPGFLIGEDPTLFLAPAKRANAIEAPADPRLRPIGELVFDEEGSGSVTFTVPDIAPGRYVALAHCANCLRGRGVMLEAGPFTSPGSVLEPFRVRLSRKCAQDSGSGGENRRIRRRQGPSAPDQAAAAASWRR